ncbi:hypothetical protein IFM89_007204, partial [Coptis chinensis]
SDQPRDSQLDSKLSGDSEEIEEQHESKEQHTSLKKQVRFNNNKLPVGPGSTQFVTFIGKMARMYCAPTYADWPIVPDEIKKHILKRDVYDLSPTRQVGVLLKANISWKNWKHRLHKVYDQYSTNSEHMENIPKRKNKKIGKALLKFARLMKRKIMESSDGTVTRTHLFVATHTIIGRDGKGRVRELGTGVTKTVVHASAPYIKIVEEKKRKRESTYENVRLVMQHLDKETRARTILEEKLEGYALEFENTSPQKVTLALAFSSTIKFLCFHSLTMPPITAAPHMCFTRELHPFSLCNAPMTEFNRPTKENLFATSSQNSIAKEQDQMTWFRDSIAH